MEKLDLKDPDIQRAMALGLAAVRMTDMRDPDFEYAQHALRMAQDVYTSREFANTPDHVASQEKKIIAQVFLVMPAVADIILHGREITLVDQIGAAAACVALELCSVRDTAELERQDLSPLAKKAARIEFQFYAQDRRRMRGPVMRHAQVAPAATHRPH